MLLKNKFHSNRLSAKALFYALVISGIISLLCGILVSIAYFFKQQQIDQFKKERLHHNINSAIAVLLGSNEELFSKKNLELFENDTDVMVISKYNWGLFSIGTVNSTAKSMVSTDSISKTIMIGIKGGPYMDAALYLTDRSKPLVLTGKTKIVGKSYLPRAGVKRGMVAGQGFMGDKLIKGLQLKSTTRFPSPNKNKMEQLLQTLNSVQGEFPVEKKISQSFTKNTLEISGQELYLEGFDLKGNIVVKAKKTIYISSNCKVEDVIFYAPKIIIEDGFKGTLQAFATSHLEIGSGCKLSYPSVLGLVITKASSNKPHVNIAANTLIEGATIVYQQLRQRYLPKMTIEEKTIIKGQVVADAEVDLKGAIYGSTLVSKFSLKTTSSTYDNYLLDATIDQSKLPGFFTGPMIFENYKSKDIAKWLY